MAALCACWKPEKNKYVANSRIHAIANTNFDGILSAYAKARFRRRLLRTIDRPSATVEPGLINVYHLHGYFQFIEDNIGNRTKEAPDIRVFTEQEFFDFFNRPNSLFSYTFLHLLREHNLLFIGMSLKDDNVRRLLHYSRTEIQKSYEKEGLPLAKAQEKSIRHYSIQERGSSSILNSTQETSLLRLGVRVIWVENVKRVPELLRELYESKGYRWDDVC